MSGRRRFEHWLEMHLGGSLAFWFMGWYVVFFGYNAMHFAVNVRTPRRIWICFQPPMAMFGQWFPWKFYISPDATPTRATFGMGPGFVR